MKTAGAERHRDHMVPQNYDIDTMSKILSYNNKTTGEGWIELNGQYSADEIEMIADPNGGLTTTPRTAIPSPFAQMDLVKNAFQRLSMHQNLQGEVMDEKLVANALDIAQLFFNIEELGQQIHIVKWSKSSELDMLRNDRRHQLLGETLEMFLDQDKEAFNFDKLDNIFFLVYGNQVIGSTSPVTLFMASPDARKGIYDIQVEQNVRLFDLWRPLYMREPHFVKYVYALFTAYPQLKEWCGEVNNYIIRCMEFLPEELHNEIIKEIGNPSAFDHSSVDKARNYLYTNYKQLENGIEALGIPLYCIKQKDILSAIQESDFVIRPSLGNEEDRLPLVLQNDLNATASDPFRYVTENWDDTIRIMPKDFAVSPEKRTLPATSHQYPWLTDDDFLQPSLVKLDYTIDDCCFFNGNLSSTGGDDAKSFLLPLKPLFFKYFRAADLWGAVAGRPMFEMTRSHLGASESVKATLRIPVKKQGQYITLTRTYIESQDGTLGFDAKNNIGHFITVPFALSIFPFVCCKDLNQYNVQLVDRSLGLLEHCHLSLDFMQEGYMQQVGEDKVCGRTRSKKAEKRVESTYYRVEDGFSHINVTLSDGDGNRVVQGVVCPKWAEHIDGHDTYTFAVDFGTTNTHMECIHGDGQPEMLSLASTARERLVATLYNGDNLLYGALMKQEFLPREIGGDYSFPLRTVLSENERMDASCIDEIVSLGDADIPFIYEKESTGYGNRIIADLKWSTEPAANKRVRAFITELALLMRTKVLLGNGDVRKTRLVWFYPLSMKVGNVRKMGNMWEKIMADVFGTDSDSGNIIQMPESVAPYYFYKCSSKFRGSASSVASIDIGGGSSDVVVFEPGAEQPSVVTSFRFAANVLFGDGFSDVPHGDTNPMVTKYVDYFRRLFDSDDDKYGELNGILADICEKRKSEDINAFLFSVENNKVAKGNATFSYNTRLNEDGTRKIIFIYFYCAIIYYVARMMLHRGIDMPRSVMFSGTGSKVLDIVGTQRDLDQITRYIFEHVYGQDYGTDGFGIIMERNEPKQITCRGALMQTRTGSGIASVNALNDLLDSYDCNLRYVFSNIAEERLTYDDMKSQEVKDMVIDSVKAFNDFFCQMCDNIHVVDTFLVDFKSLQAFKSIVNKDLDHHLANGWKYMNRDIDEKNGHDTVEDAVFFYPIIGSIRDNLIENLKY